MRVGYAVFGLLGLTLVAANACSGETGPSTTTSIGVTAAGATTGTGGGGAPPAPCVPECGAGLTCCDGVCANLDNDVHNCGSCQKNCPGPHALCAAGDCEQAPCTMQQGCLPGEFCCDAQCCPFEVLCCEVNGAFECTPPNENDTCPP